MSSMIDLNQFVKNLKTTKDVQEFVKSITKDVVQRMLNEEMNQHLGYEKHASQGKKSGNSRNGYSFKKVNSTVGEVDLEIPRDRNGVFEPRVVKKYQTCRCKYASTNKST